MMKRTPPPASPDAYFSSLTGWRKRVAEALRAEVLSLSALEEVIKWGHAVYLANGPVLLIRAEDERVLFGFWRGKRLTAIEPRLKGSGKYEMRSLELREGMSIDPQVARALVKQAVELNETLGDPTKAAPAPSRAGTSKRVR